jgi:hypothetical protein
MITNGMSAHGLPLARGHDAPVKVTPEPVPVVTKPMPRPAPRQPWEPKPSRHSRA